MRDKTHTAGIVLAVRIIQTLPGWQPRLFGQAHALFLIKIIQPKKSGDPDRHSGIRSYSRDARHQNERAQILP
ncbi:MAG: hypothetical protein HY846_01340 [Nitrosomonadales bacterium]|nr:hypothetical protein [Nitrosomonadales bacterium]